MNLLHLEYFYVVAKEQGFTKASKALRIQQPAISRMVRFLEDDFGFRLFEKVGRNVQLTPAGMEVFEYCKNIFGVVDDLKQSLGKISGECKGPLYIGASEPIASRFLPSVMKDFLSRHPLVYPNIFSGPASSVFEYLVKGEVEMGLFFHVPELPAKLEIFKTTDVRFYLVIKKDLRKKKDILETFIGSREIDDTSTKRFPTLDRLRKDFPSAKIKISSNNLTAHREMVLQGMGVSILPDFLVEQDIKKNLLWDIYPRERFIFQMKFIKRRTGVLSLPATELIKFCEAVGGN
jgi:DNA-binding transcriptional LysR family regulator